MSFCYKLWHCQNYWLSYSITFLFIFYFLCHGVFLMIFSLRLKTQRAQYHFCHPLRTCCFKEEESCTCLWNKVHIDCEKTPSCPIWISIGLIYPFRRQQHHAYWQTVRYRLSQYCQARRIIMFLCIGLCKNQTPHIIFTNGLNFLNIYKYNFYIENIEKYL